MRIGELSERTGASVRSLRYYEAQGLLHSERTPSGQRVYREDAIDYVQLIRVFLAAGLPSRRILEMMPCMRSGTTTSDQREMLDGAGPPARRHRGRRPTRRVATGRHGRARRLSTTVIPVRALHHPHELGGEGCSQTLWERLRGFLTSR